MLSDREKAFLDHQRIARLATADKDAAPHVVPVCFAIDAAGRTLYTTVDQKPKRPGGDLKRLRNIRENSSVSVIIDRYDDDWSKLGWVMLRGEAEILSAGGGDAKSPSEHAVAQSQLMVRYPQYAAMTIIELPVIALRIKSVTSWGNLDP